MLTRNLYEDGVKRAVKPRRTPFFRPPGRVGLLLALAAAAGCATYAARPSDLTLDEKIGQLFVYAARGVFLNEQSPDYRELLRQVRENRVGGILWYQTENVYETAWLNDRLQAAARVPLLVSADLETGLGMRFADTTDWPWPMAIAATGDPSLAEREGRIVGEEARAVGINQVYAPVADVNSDPENPTINVRSYGEDPEDAARFVAAFVRGVQGAGVVATAKHFPGHGDTHTDSHRSLPVLAASPDDIERRDLPPFRAAIAAGVRAIMTAHLAVPSLDASPAPARPEGVRENPYTQDAGDVARDATVPATLSPAITTALLRKRLGFSGLVVTDAMDMGALVDHFDPGEAAVRAILAGADQIPKTPDVDRAIAAVRQAVASGRISRDRVDESVRRILEVKRFAGAPRTEPSGIFRIVDRPEHRAFAEELARRSLTLVREEPGVLPLRAGGRFIQVNVTVGPERIGGDFARELRGRASEPPRSLALDNRSAPADVEPILEAARGADAVLVALFVRVSTGRGTIAIPAVARDAIERLAASGARVVAISFGSPYVLSDLPGVRTALAAYGSQADGQVAAARALFGEAAITGRLPVTIPGIAPRGTGIQKPAGKAS